MNEWSNVLNLYEWSSILNCFFPASALRFHKKEKHKQIFGKKDIKDKKQATCV